MIEVLKNMVELAEMLDPEEFIQVIEEGKKFQENLEKYEADLHKKLDKMVKDGEITEHEARQRFYAGVSEFTEKCSEETAKRIIMKRHGEEAEDDTVDETECEEDTGEETHVDMGDPSGDRNVIDIHIHCHRNDCE